MLSPPYYNKPSQEGIYQHYKKIIESINKDFMIYNVPSRCGVNIEPETISRLYTDFVKIKAIKEASGSIDQVIKIKSLSNIEILSGDDGLVLPFMSVGAVGIISVVSNIVPREMNTIIEHFNNGKNTEAIKMFYKIHKLIKLCFIESNPVPLKYIINKLNFNILPKVRLPLVYLSQNNRLIIDEHINDNSIIKLMPV
jgi:4-hydroxy-tetrahydrodipicolinate synthase